MPYRYETHLHTSAASACAIALPRDYIPFYIDQGYHGLVVTDHFFGGNTAIDRDLPWRERINQFCRGYEEAKNEGDKRGLQVLFDWEQAYRGDEYLVYGLNKQWLLEHPEVDGWTRAQQYEGAHFYGGCVVQAHPFRNRSYIRRIHLNTACVDGVEVYNATNPLEVNVQAYRYAQSLGLTMLAGSDIHAVQSGSLSGISLETPLRDEQDLAQRIREHAPITLLAPMEVLQSAPLAPVTLPVEVLGANAQPIDIPYQHFLR